MPQLGPWICDECGEEIADPAAGYVLWRHDDAHRPQHFRVIHQGRCDDDTYTHSLPLENFVGVDGLNRLLSILSLGQLKLAWEHTTSRGVVDNDEFVDFVRRMQIPGYEQARQRYDDPEVQEWYSDSNEYYPYMQATLDRFLSGGR